MTNMAASFKLQFAKSVYQVEADQIVSQVSAVFTNAVLFVAAFDITVSKAGKMAILVT